MPNRFNKKWPLQTFALLCHDYIGFTANNASGSFYIGFTANNASGSFYIGFTANNASGS